MFTKPTYNPEIFFQPLIGELKKELPGKVFQNQTAPSVRSHKNIPPSSPPKNSSVLVLLYPSSTSINTLLIKRADYNGAHSGQISFPGGKHEKFDPDLIHTAFREAKEEIGINPKKINFLGLLSSLYIRKQYACFAYYCKNRYKTTSPG